jgi:hypothetical protein
MNPMLVYRISGGIVALGALIIGLSAFASGGGATVCGHVTMQGRPVIWGSVVLAGLDGQSVPGRIQPDGTYTVENAPVGEVVVTVISPDPLVDHYKTQIRSSRVAVPVNEWAACPVDRQQWFVVPKKYENAATSDLKLTVKRGNNPDMDLTLTP